MAGEHALPRPRTGTPATGAASVLIIAGGAFQEVRRYQTAAGADLVLHLDVPSEMDLGRPQPGVVSVTLAEGETLATLARKVGCSAEFEEFTRARPGVNLSLGLGQLRAVGGLAVRRFLDDPAFERFLFTEIFERLLIRHNGYLSQVEVTVLTSTAGGTGGAVGRPVAEALARVLFAHTDATVQIQLVRIGSLSYVTLGDRLHRNSAATIDEDIEYVLARDRHPHEVRSLVLAEIPMTGRHKDQRDAYAVQLTQALRAPKVREILGRSEPNVALDSPWGTVSIVQVGWWKALPGRQVAAEVAALYLPRLKRILGAGPKVGSVGGIEVDLGQGKVEPAQPLEAVVDLVRRSGKVMPPNFVETCLHLHGQFTAAIVWVRLLDGEINLAARLRIESATPCRTEAEFIEKLSVLRAVDQGLEDEIRLRARKIESLRRARDRAHAALTRAVRRLYPKGFVERLAAALGDPNARLVSFKDAVIRARENACELARLEAEDRVLRGVRGQLGAELEAEGQRLKRVIDRLAAVRTSREAGDGERSVNAVDLDAVLGDLLDVMSREGTDPDELLRLLGSSARSVTLSGLARIAEAPEPRAAGIAARFAGAEPPIQGPVWGGKKPMGHGTVITVLPPLDPPTEEEMRRALLGADPEIVPACADTAQGGVNALRLEVFKPRHRDEIFTPFIRKNLEKANQEPGIYRTNGFPAAVPGQGS